MEGIVLLVLYSFMTNWDKLLVQNLHWENVSGVVWLCSWFMIDTGKHRPLHCDIAASVHHCITVPPHHCGTESIILSNNYIYWIGLDWYKKKQSEQAMMRKICDWHFSLAWASAPTSRFLSEILPWLISVMKC